MSQNIFENVQDFFGGDTMRQTSESLGESESNVSSALRSVVPLVLGGLFSRAQQPGGTSELFGMAQQAHSSGILSNLGGLLGGLTGASTATPGADQSLLSKGSDLLQSIFGNQYTPAVEGVSQQANVSSSLVGNLMRMAVPVVLGLLGKHAATNNLDANGFGSYLSGQRSNVMSAMGNLPSGLGAILSGLGATGLGSTISNAKAQVAETAASAGTTAARATAPVAAAPSRWPWLLLLVAALAAVWYFMRSCDKTPDAAMPTTTEMPAADNNVAAAPAPMAATGRYDDATGNYVYDVGALSDISLPDGTSINVGANSVESRLFNFLNDANATVSDDKTQGWMSLDRVYFETGKANLTAESQAQLRNIAAIMKAFPGSAIKFGGYTDNVGKADTNLTLSADRANAARKMLMDNGVDAGRVAAEGYGQEHPLTTNDTPEGRAQNRRVDVRVTKK
ncbi:OmpA family protein [Hymenobacter actinosclerus]|uniref:Outer membrane protein OmpA n=1 Tax=Hymenobacter actinosclerus TaxID=82805 RepID=A0A1I0HI31_9BACT|nr:OmpA family protein [Hymenobacter actinosclerus]SET82711.1 Outer membrane protein OmpA [Hymenobacter actinosclerus]